MSMQIWFKKEGRVCAEFENPNSEDFFLRVWVCYKDAAMDLMDESDDADTRTRNSALAALAHMDIRKCARCGEFVDSVHSEDGPIEGTVFACRCERAI